MGVREDWVVFLPRQLDSCAHESVSNARITVLWENVLPLHGEASAYVHVLILCKNHDPDLVSFRRACDYLQAVYAADARADTLDCWRLGTLPYELGELMGRVVR